MQGIAHILVASHILQWFHVDIGHRGHHLAFHCRAVGHHDDLFEHALVFFEGNIEGLSLEGYRLGDVADVRDL